ncbi:D-alanyl-D-alanine carboxypeptidase family protein [Streptomyces sp. NPDC006879]|uniref:D-alanyl-D-alanine carboxypeptidase family protein n=1 Tax=Streptomyces sp. NPDC006879 TaxID=3364767 RepID=UPI0036CC4AD0
MSAKKTAVTVLTAAALLLPAALATTPAFADPTPGPDTGGSTTGNTSGKADAKQPGKNPAPPAAMSTVGGTRLGKPGTQVQLGPGAPALPKELSGRSWIVADAESGEVFAAHNAHWRLPPASTLKMLFADTVLPRLPKDEKHTVAPSELAPVGPGSSLVGVKENLSYSVHDLWLGVFLRSGNDAVHVLAAMNGGVPKTVQDMQEHADELQALDTHVVSPDGYDAPGQVSSAYDLTLFARSGMQKKDFREYAATATAKFPGAELDGKLRDSFEIQNTNRLMTGAYGVTPYKGIAGVKNGTTSLAGSTFTGIAQRGDRVLLVTVMNPSTGGGNQVYEETAALFDWGFAAAGKVTPVGELVPPKSADSTSHGAPARTHTDKKPGTAGAAAQASGGLGTALAVVGGVLVVLGAGVFLVNRLWPSRRRRPEET